MKNKFKNTALAVLSISVVALFFVAFNNGTTEKNAFIQIGQVYSDFDLTKEMNNKFENIANKRKLILDSIKLNLQQVEMAASRDQQNEKLVQQYYQLQRHLQQKEGEFQQSNDLLSSQYNEQIMNQLNQYVKDYGEDHGYSFIYGANGNGSIMFAKKSNDITEEMVKYVNSRYQGNKR